MAARAGAPFYSAHAGFCIDPAPEDMGRKLPPHEPGPRNEYWSRFVEAVKELTAEAADLRIQFLVENNVLALFNVLPDGSTPLLCAGHEEIERLLEEVASASLGMLLDTGHLKVSAESLHFSKDTFLTHVAPYVRGIHHSDNDGAEDTNQPVTGKYWFLRHMPRYAGAYHILEVHDQTIAQIREQYRLLEKAAEGPNR